MQENVVSKTVDTYSFIARKRDVDPEQIYFKNLSLEIFFKDLFLFVGINSLVQIWHRCLIKRMKLLFILG